MEFYVKDDGLIYSTGSFNWTAIEKKGLGTVLAPQSSVVRVLEDPENTTICIPSQASIKIHESVNTTKLTIVIPKRITEFIKIYIITLRDSKIKLIRDYLPYFEKYLELYTSVRNILISGYSNLRDQDKYFTNWIKLFKGNGLSIDYFDHDMVIHYS